MLALMKNGEYRGMVSEGASFEHTNAEGQIDVTSPAYDGWSSEDGWWLAEIQGVEPVPEGKIILDVGVEIREGTPYFTYILADAPVVRFSIAKSVVQARIITKGKMAQAYAMLVANPIYFARWFAPDHPVVYCDDPDAMILVRALGLDPQEILAPE
jgi:hypothetical protein